MSNAATNEVNKGMPPQFADKNKKKDEEQEEKAKKAFDEGDLGEEELVKSLDKLAEFANSAPTSRKQVLLEKAQTGELSDEEKTELVKALGIQTPEPTPVEEVTKSLDPEANGELNDAFDATGYIHELHKGFQAYATELADRVEKSQSQQNELSLVLCKGIADIGKIALNQARLMKSLQEQINSFGRQPAAPRRSAASPAQVVEKSFTGGANGAGGEQLSKADILNTLDAMHEASLTKGYGNGGGTAQCGEDFRIAIAKYENPRSEISQALFNEVLAFRRQHQS